MTREELLSSPEYWLVNAQGDLFGAVSVYMDEHGLKRKDLAQKLGVTAGRVSQILSGEDHPQLNKFFEVALAVDYVPLIVFTKLTEFIEYDKLGYDLTQQLERIVGERKNIQPQLNAVSVDLGEQNFLIPDTSQHISLKVGTTQLPDQSMSEESSYNYAIAA